MELSLRLSKRKPRPNDKLKFHFELKNKSNSSVYIRDASLSLPWTASKVSLQVKTLLNPPTRGWLGLKYDQCGFDFTLDVPKFVIGEQLFELCLINALLHEDNRVDRLQEWITSWPAVFSVEPTYTAFVSRSIRPHEAYIPNELSQVIRGWNFRTVTVGIEVEVGDRPPEEVIGEAIQCSDIVFAIATKRDKLENRPCWRTLEYLQGEVGYSYSESKPIVVLVEEGVDIGGLASCFEPIVFDPRRFSQFKQWFNGYLYDIRERVKKCKRKKFWEDLVDGLIEYGIPAGLFFLGGYLTRDVLKKDDRKPIS